MSYGVKCTPFFLNYIAILNFLISYFFTIAKFFQLHANQRRRINHIGTLQVNGATLVTKEEKAETAFHYFSCILGHDP
jgi:hypothetical protein